ncbi:MAG: hypothetical protein J5663_10460 [Bacteroidaceae bacterium]|nr:hypothetical protein [Bacteroidaceae bacterium]
MRISRFTSTVLRNKAVALIATSLLSVNALGQTITGETTEGKVTITDSTVVVNGENKPTKWVPSWEEEEPPLMFFQGFTLSFDILGAGMRAMSSNGSLEAALRLNLKNTYFPIAELGVANCNKTDDNTNIHYVTSAPYFRIGFDYNVLKDKRQDNRLFVGARYGISTFNYDVQGPKQIDPIWGGEHDFALNGINCTSQWLEICFGCQVKVWSSFHMGWSIRYKSELSSSNSDNSKPYYIPGYGTTTTGSCWGGTYNLIFDLNWGKKKKSATAVQVQSENQ